MDSIKNHDVKALEILSIVLDIIGLIPFSSISTIAGVTSLGMHLV